MENHLISEIHLVLDLQLRFTELTGHVNFKIKGATITSSLSFLNVFMTYYCLQHLPSTRPGTP